MVWPLTHLDEVVTLGETKTITSGLIRGPRVRAPPGYKLLQDLIRHHPSSQTMLMADHRYSATETDDLVKLEGSTWCYSGDHLLGAQTSLGLFGHESTTAFPQYNQSIKYYCSIIIAIRVRYSNVYKQ